MIFLQYSPITEPISFLRMDVQKLPFTSDIPFLSTLASTRCFFEKVFYNTFHLKNTVDTITKNTVDTIKKEVGQTRLAGEDLFSLFTADIIKERQIFTR